MNTPNHAPLSPDLQLLKDWLLAHTGLAYYQNRDAELQQIFQQQMAQNDLKPFQGLDYLHLLQSPEGATPLNKLIDELTIGESYFFRYHEQFEALQHKILPLLLPSPPARQERPLRVWSAGCATGEEPYSLALLLYHFFDHHDNSQSLILGSDLNPLFLERARTAVYRNWSFREQSARWQQPYFQEEADQWRLKDPLRQRVQFIQHNLADLNRPWPLALQGPFDLILCRNVLIYFSAEHQKKLIQRFYELLSPQGWLLLGPAELTALSCAPFPLHDLARYSCFPRQLNPTDSASPQPAAKNPGPQQRGQEGPTGSGAKPFRRRPAQTRQSPVSLPRQLRQIRQLADSGAGHEALEYLARALQDYPLAADLHYYQGLVLNSQNKSEAARLALERCLQRDSQHLLGRYHLGLIYQQLGDSPKARALFAELQRDLASLPPDMPLPHGDGLRVSQLHTLLQKQVRV